jgi:hypothetical protein
MRATMNFFIAFYLVIQFTTVFVPGGLFFYEWQEIYSQFESFDAGFPVGCCHQ